ncbi:MAG: hypothetical protein C0623_03425 [Desulfuromonas sp.]|nr:MAG: hypothetical protein C0623_03425 [Desulfuromonas sp.]
MKRLNIKVNLLVLLVATFIVLPLSAQAAHHEKQQTTAADVRDEVGEAYKVFSRYTLQQRDEAVDAAEKRLKELDAKIEEVEQDIKANWKKMNQAARKEANQTLKSLRQQRNEVAEWLGGVRHSSSEAWEEVKKGFSDSYDRLKKAFDKASKKFKSN